MENIGFIFDMDGVIVDNHHYHFLSWQQLAEQQGLSIDEVFYREHMNGRTMMEIMNTLFKDQVTPEQAKKLAVTKEDIYRDLYRSELKPTDGLLDFLELSKKEGIPMAVGTSAPEVNVAFTLDGLEIRHYFDAIFDERAVTKGKPDPQIYQKCAQGINRENSRCLVFEDAISGIKAGKSAGSKVVGLATSHKREELNADLIIDDFTSFTLDTAYSMIND
ncbi:MAG: HAD family phosphatase [Bacteroidota bacterium]